jgi:peptidoglycan hydrolase-like protein with peptidoglycan-binding domain
VPSANLPLGSRGPDVTKLQQFLAWEYSNFYSSYVTGYFGPITQAAVKQWQREHNIVSSGTPWTTGYGAVGPRTRAAMAAACGATSSSTAGTLTSTSSGAPFSFAPPTPAAPATAPSSAGGTASTQNQCPFFGLPVPTQACPDGGSWQALDQSNGCQYGWQCSVPAVSTFAPGTNTTPQSTSPVVTTVAPTVTTVAPQTTLFTFNSLSGRVVNVSFSNLPSSSDIVFVSQTSGQPTGPTIPESGSNTVSITADQSVPVGSYYLLAEDANRQYLAQTIAFTLPSVGAASECTLNDEAVPNGGSVTAYQAATVPYGQQCVSQQRTCTNGALSGSYTSSACTVGPPSACTLNGETVQSGQSATFYSDAGISYGDSCSNYAQTRTCTNGTLSGDSSYQYGSCVVGQPAACSFNNQSVANAASVTAYQSSTVAFGSQCVSQSRTCTNGTLSGSYQYPSCSVQQAAFCTFNGQTVANGASVTVYQNATVPNGQQCVSQQRTCSNGTLSGSYGYAACSVNMPTVTAVSPIAAINVANGTLLSAVGLPSQVTVTLSDGTTPTYPATWNGGSPSYNGAVPGTYTFTGTLTLPAGVTNPNNLTASVQVVVAAAPSFGSVTIAGSANTGPGVDVYTAYLFSAPLPGAVDITGMSGTLSITPGTGGFSEALFRVIVSNRCAANGAGPYTDAQAGQFYSGYDGQDFGNFILKTPNGGAISLPISLTFPLPIPASGCVTIWVDGNSYLTMTSNLSLQYANAAPPSPAPYFIGIEDEFCFGQNWGCQLATEGSGAQTAFMSVVPITQPVQLLSLSGDVSDAPVSGSPTGAWTMDNDYYVYPSCAMSAGDYGPADYYSQIPANAQHLLSVPFSGNGLVSLEGAQFKSFSGVILNPGDCLVHLVRTTANAGIDAENQMSALVQPVTVADAADKSVNLANALSALESALQALSKMFKL